VTPRLTPNVRAVLQAIRSGHLYGLNIMKVTGLPSGTVYPLLARLEAAGWLVSAEAPKDPDHPHRPQRRTYRTTSLAPEGT
jgi:PadR family transcriptional regulator PadR